MRRGIVVALLIISSIKASAQISEGGSVNFGLSIGEGHCAAYNRLFNEYNSLRPWLDETAYIRKSRYGFSLGIGGTIERLNISGTIFGFKTSTYVHGIDPTGVEYNQTFILKTRGFEFVYAYYFIQTDYFRAGPSIGLTGTSAFLKSTDKDKATRSAEALLRIILLLPGGSTQDVGQHVFAGGKVGFTIAIGNHNAFAIEPFYVIPFWKVNVKEDSEKLNNSHTPTYPDQAYKSYYTQYGIRMSMCIGMAQNQSKS